METTKNYFLRDLGVVLGRSVLRSRETLIAVAVIILPIVFVLLLVYVSGRAIQTLEEIVLAIINGKKEN